MPRRTSNARPAARLARALFLLRNPLAGLPAVVALVSTRGACEPCAFAWPLGIVLVVLGIGLRAWSVCHNAYGRRRPRTLAETGPYAWTRNPLYLANAAIIAGAVATSKLLWLVPLGFAWSLLVFTAVARREERRLAERYGDAYRAYAARVPRWLPRRPSARTPQGDRVGLAEVARAVPGQAGGLLLLVPFVAKALDPLGLWT